MKSKLEKAVECIKGYCNKHNSCKTCKFGKEEFCHFYEKTPCEWEFPKEDKHDNKSD